MIKSPLRYPGGKSRAVKTILPLVPKFDEYREPFVGGGSVYVHLKQIYQHKLCWVNDIYTNLYHFWNECQKHPDELIKAINQFRLMFDSGKELHRYLLENIESFDPLHKGAAFFAFNRITFSGTTESGGFSNAAFHKRFTDSSIERVKSFSKLLANTRITNNDYEELVFADGKGVFIFLDPPYYSATKSALYGKNGSLHKTFDHKRFSEVMRECPHKWLITYDDSVFIRKLFSYAQIQKWDLTYGMRNVTKENSQIGNEVFISNYNLDMPVQMCVFS